MIFSTPIRVLFSVNVKCNQLLSGELWGVTTCARHMSHPLHPLSPDIWYVLQFSPVSCYQVSPRQHISIRDGMCDSYQVLTFHLTPQFTGWTDQLYYGMCPFNLSYFFYLNTTSTSYIQWTQGTTPLTKWTGLLSNRNKWILPCKKMWNVCIEFKFPPLLNMLDITLTKVYYIGNR